MSWLRNALMNLVVVVSILGIGAELAILIYVFGSTR